MTVSLAPPPPAISLSLYPSRPDGGYTRLFPGVLPPAWGAPRGVVGAFVGGTPLTPGGMCRDRL